LPMYSFSYVLLPVSGTGWCRAKQSLTANNVVFLVMVLVPFCLFAAGASGNVLVSNGTTWTSNATVANASTDSVNVVGYMGIPQIVKTEITTW